jgi:hypothetical protein
LYRHGSRGEDGSSARIHNVIKRLQHLTNQSVRATNSPTDEIAQVLSPPINVEEQTAGLPANVPNEVTGPASPGSGGFPDAGVPTQPRCSSTVYRLFNISEDTDNPYLRTDPLHFTGTEYIAMDASTHITNDATRPAHNPREGSTPPQSDTRGPPTPPSCRVRTRGAFIIGNGAPVKIDENIEVHLRDGVNGHVDFII